METNDAPHADLHTILSNVDLDTLLIRHLTILEAARLSGTCRTARTLVRRGEADGVFRPMWAIELVLARLERYRQPFFASGGLVYRETTALARLLLTEILPAGVIELKFNVQSMRATATPAGGTLQPRQNMLGCTELFVLDPIEWVTRLHRWAKVEGSCFSDGMDDDEFERRSRHNHPGSYMLELLRKLGLAPTGNNLPDFLFGHLNLPAELHSCMSLCPRVWLV